MSSGSTGARSWKNGMCGCCCGSGSSVLNCCYACVCPWCAYGAMYAEVSHGSCCAPCCGICIADACLPGIVSGVSSCGLCCASTSTGPPCGICLRMNNRYVIGRAANVYTHFGVDNAACLTLELLISETFCYSCSYAQQMAELSSLKQGEVVVGGWGDITGLLTLQRPTNTMPT